LSLDYRMKGMLPLTFQAIFSQCIATHILFQVIAHSVARSNEHVVLDPELCLAWRAKRQSCSCSARAVLVIDPKWGSIRH